MIKKPDCIIGILVINYNNTYFIFVVYIETKHALVGNG